MEDKKDIQEEIVNEETVEVENPAVDDTKVDPKQEEPKEKKGFFGKKEDTEKKKLQEEVAMLKDKYLRTSAEMQNMKRRMEEERANLLKYDGEELIKKLLPVVDNFERAISMDDNNFGDETSKFLEGFRLVYKQTKSLLEKFEVQEIDCLDKEFDPTYEQAVVVEKDETKAPGTVIEVLQKGYMYKDRVLRIAMVKVNE